MNNFIKEQRLKLTIKSLEKQRRIADQNADYFQNLYFEIGKRIVQVEEDLWDIEKARALELCEKNTNLLMR